MSLSKVHEEFLDWADATIPHPAASTLLKLAREVEELVEEPCAAEAADVFMCLAYWCHASGIDLAAAVQEKMAVNRQRQFVQDPDGTWRHVKTAA